MIKTHAKNHPKPKSVVQLIEWPNLRNLSWSLAGHQHRFFWVAQLHCQQKQPNSVWQAHFATPPLDGWAFSPYLSEVKLWSWRICADIVMNIYGLWIRQYFFVRVSNGFSFFSPDASSCRASVWQDFTKLIMDRLDSCALYSFPSLHHVASRLHFWYPANHPVGLIKLSWSSTASICLFKASESKALAKRAPQYQVVVCQALLWNHFPCKWIMSFESHN